MIIKYGLKDNNIDVTSICYDKLKSGIFIIIPKSDHERARYFTDPYMGKLKSVFIINETDNNNQIEYDHNKTIYINTILNNVSILDEISTIDQIFIIKPKQVTIDLEIPIYIYWHIFIDSKGHLKAINIIQRQFKKINDSGLLDRCNAIYIGYVSEIDFPCENIISHPKVKIVIREKSGDEGVTSTSLKKFCNAEEKESLILYIHNRGMRHNEDCPAWKWTYMMEYFVIEKWRNSISLLEDKYTCGCELFSHNLRNLIGQQVPKENKNDYIFHYAGNFWWSRSSYIKLLPYPNLANRFSVCEDWILQLAEHMIPKENFGILHRTSKNRYEKGLINSYKHNYDFIYYASGKETPDLEINLELLL